MSNLTTTASLFPSVLKDQICYIKEQIAELEAKHFLEEITLREYNSQCEELWEQLDALINQQANW